MTNEKHKYFILVGGGIGEVQYTKTASTPENAAIAFFDGQNVAPTDVSVHGTKASMEALISWAKNNKTTILDFMAITEADKIFKPDYWVKMLDGASLDEASFMDFGDGREPEGQAYPFTGG